MNTCDICSQPRFAIKAIIYRRCAAADHVSQDAEISAPCVVCNLPTCGTGGDEFPVCLRCYATGKLTDEHIALYGHHTEDS